MKALLTFILPSTNINIILNGLTNLTFLLKMDGLVNPLLNPFFLVPCQIGRRGLDLSPNPIGL